ncbi:MAG TPA: hypothetical protein VLV48_10410 [Thermoanaerobaculia bacterium]|nr:hypothetical protein [Thermoanaerobaculia bacterium]
MRRSLTAALAIAAAAFAAGCYAPEVRHASFRQEWPAAPIDRVEVRGTNGRIEISAAPGETIRMEARVRSRKRGESERIEDFVVVKREGGTLTIREKGARRGIRLLPFGKDGNEVDFTITLPAQTKVVATTVNGRVEVDGVAAPMELSSVNGRIQLSTPGAPVSASTVNGSIRAEFLHRFVGAKLASVNGSIGIEVPRDASLDLDIHQLNGSFRTDLPVVVTSGGHGGSHGSLHGGKYPLEINTVNGSVRLRQADVPALDATRG